MQMGMIGLGKMGSNMVLRLQRGGHNCVGFDLDPKNFAGIEKEGADSAKTIDELVQKLQGPRVVWVMVPSGKATDSTIETLKEKLSKDDIVIDGGNSFYKDDIRHAQILGEKGIHFIDAGTSGGVWGIDRGYCLMIGGEKSPVQHCDPIFACLAPGKGDVEPTPGRDKLGGTSDQGYLHCGPVGAGHFVKMVHNGIEYGVMQAYAEGFDILKSCNQESIPAERRYDLNMADVAEVWRRGSVIGSWLLDLAAIALAKDPVLSGYKGEVHDSGEGRWTVNAAVEEGVAANVIASSLFTRFRSQKDHTFTEKVCSAMRMQFGGHVEGTNN